MRFQFLLSLFLFFIILPLQADESVYKIQRNEDIVSLFPKSKKDTQIFKNQSLESGSNKLKKVINSIRCGQHKKIILREFDELLLYLKTKISIAEAMTLIDPREEVREVAHSAQLTLQEKYDSIFIEQASIYNFFKNSFHTFPLSTSEKNFVSEIIYKFEVNGQSLPSNEKAQVQKLKSQISKLEQLFLKNIQEDDAYIYLREENLDGVGEEVKASLPMNKKGFLKINSNHPHYGTVLCTCNSQPVRKRLIELRQNRGYPSNEEVLKDLIIKRNELANILGFKSFAHLRLHNEMSGTPERALTFLNDLWKQSYQKEKAEFKSIAETLPPSISLNKNGKVESWDVSYVTNYYKRKTFSLNKDLIAQYFPIDQTFIGLMKIFEEFFDIHIKKVPISGLWHEDIQMLEISDKKENILGYILLDLFHRKDKYSHACDIPIIAGAIVDGKRYPALDVVVTSFPKGSDEIPTLLKYYDVQTFFHEFGHAIHDILIQNEVLYYANIFNMKYDFIELPSQLLEEWLWEPEILKKISCHYQTKQPMPDHMIDKIVRTKNAFSGYFVQSQCYLSKLALELFSGDVQDPTKLSNQLNLNLIPNYEPLENSHFHLSFGHLTEYGPVYYGYLWSKVFALDIFNEIKKEGLLNPGVGVRYRKEILEKGSSVDPNILLKNFLGRPPSQEAFIKSLEL